MLFFNLLFSWIEMRYPESPPLVVKLLDSPGRAPNTYPWLSAYSCVMVTFEYSRVRYLGSAAGFYKPFYVP